VLTLAFVFWFAPRERPLARQGGQPLDRRAAAPLAR
jgi:hypothetical protein